MYKGIMFSGLSEEDHLGLSLESGDRYEKICQMCNLLKEEAQEIAVGRQITNSMISTATNYQFRLPMFRLPI